MTPRRPAGPGRLAVLLAPGAGADRNHSALVAIEAALAPDVVVERMDFPYRRAGRRAPDKAPVLVESVRQAAAELAARSRVPGERLVLGGRSLGGRICSMAVAEGLPAAGLVVVSYPLHPPGRPERARVEHLPMLRVPCLFVSGTRDAFGTPAELEAAAATIPGLVEMVWVDGGDHGLRRRDQEVADRVAAWVRALS